jgi:hypothetical protein
MTNYEKVKKWRENNKDKVNEQAKRYRLKHPESNKKAKEKYRENNIEAIRERDKVAQRKSRKNNPEAQRIRSENYRIRQELKKITIAGRPKPFLCELCNEDKFKIVFDHCHKSDKFRGWICDRCNKVLGLVYDSPELLKNMKNYLEKFNGKINSKI